MRNLELCNITREVLEEAIWGFSKITFSEDCIYLLKDSKLTVFNRQNQEVKVLPTEYVCVTDLEVLVGAFSWLWFGTGSNFVTLKTTESVIVQTTPQEQFLVAKWNPTQETLAIVTEDKVELYSADCSMEHTMLLEKHDLLKNVTNPFISVGWGSSQTQFKGKQSSETHINSSDSFKDLEVAVTDFDDHMPRLCWSSDGEYYTVNYILNNCRIFRTYHISQNDVYECDNIIGLQPLIAWRPIGNIIACPVWTSKRCGIMLFEKNGLQRTFFQLLRNHYVVDLKWNKSGNILAVHQRGDRETSSIYLYVVRNLKWSLMQELNFIPQSSIMNFEFIESTSLIDVLRVVTSREILEYSFKNVNYYTRHAYSDNVITSASFNGCDLYLTNCRDGLIPDPFYSYVVTNKSPINFIIFHPDKPKFAIIDSKNIISLFNFDETTASVVGCCHIEHTDQYSIPLRFHHFVWYKDDEIICLADVDFHNKNYRKKCTIKIGTDPTDSNHIVFDIEFSPIEHSLQYEQITYLTHLQNQIMFQKLIEIHLVQENGKTQCLATLNEPSVYILWSIINDKIYTYVLNTKTELYMNDSLVMKGVKSIQIHEEYLFLTTVDNELKCVRLDEQALNEFCKIGCSYAYSQSIEPGSVVLFGIPRTSCALLEVPRGNVEICSCRMIILDTLEKLVSEKKWVEALNLVRLNKLSPSVIIDFDIDKFIDNIPLFIDDIKNCLMINDFILGIETSNVLLTVYSDCHIIVKSIKTVDKLNVLREKLVEHMSHKNYAYYLNSIVLTCFITETSENIQKALEHIRIVMHMVANKKRMLEPEKAVQCLSNLISTDEIYNETLRSYDLDLALFVARHLQMDPRVFEPFIAELNASNESEKRFKINDYLNQPKQAVIYLMMFSENKERIYDYVVKHKVYKEIYDLIDPDSEFFKRISHSYGNALSDNKRYEEAGIIYTHASFFREAIQAYSQIFSWRQVLSVLKISNIPSNEKIVMLQNLVRTLIETKMISAAAHILDTELQNYETALELLLEHKYFTEADILIDKHNCRDAYGYKIYKGVQDYCYILLEKFENLKQTFVPYRIRLREIRAKKKEILQRKQNVFTENSVNVELDETISIMDSVSVSTRSSTSSRSRRKDKRKRDDLRHGNVYEDIALIKALHTLISEVFQYAPEVRLLYFLELKINRTSKYVIQIHKPLKELQEEMLSSISEIWPSGMNNHEENPDIDTSFIHSNVKFMDIQYRMPPVNIKPDSIWSP